MVEADARLAAALLDAWRALQREYGGSSLKRVESERLSTNEAWLLAYIGRGEGIRLSALATWQGVDRSTISTQVASLERRGLVERRVDPADARASLISVTRDGAKQAARQRSAAESFVEGIVGDWSTQDRMVLAELLERLAAGMTRSD
jgi:DNA-binding MarR family transcriptional regulator